ncbi:hypothetical protein M2I88_15255 [Pseudomonas aeruginosa]|uniref:hypothetical protein n=1 Tax=Pseudomonas aeruginosa TaxID=287 RepID=UPI0024C082D4|nr:hypothetical protein [Pseudomonas aeruginosa]MBX6868999.1 hypothetical protein [Pseudomonas aeruginosa]WHV41230.1 hypothetical protein M2I88_15255 [Pseudomonas aeruginosa]
MNISPLSSAVHRANSPHQSGPHEVNSNNSVRITYHDDSIEIVGYGYVPAINIYAHLSQKSLGSLTKTLTRMASHGRYSDGAIYTSLYALNKFLLTSPNQDFTEQSIHSLHAMSHHADCNFLFNIKRLLLYWYRCGYPGISDDAAELLKTLKSPIKPRAAGSRIRSDDPTEGWYTDKEYDELVAALWDDLERRVTPLDKSTLCLLSAQYGRRPIQFSHLKIGDLKEHGKTHAVAGKRIEFPGAKERGTGRFREAAIEVHPLSEELWDLCQIVARQTIQTIEELTGLSFTPEQAKQLPLFSMGEIDKRLKKVKSYDKDLHFIYSSRLLHVPNASISRILARSGIGTKVISERTGEVLIENAYRNRYTRTRQLARAGLSRTQLQFWLGHKTDKSLEAYYSDPAAQAAMLSTAMRSSIAPIARAFTGPIRDNERDATRGHDPSSRVAYNGQSDSNVGSCGEKGYCSAGVPIACYRCPYFEPWIDGPHEQVLRLLEEKERRQHEIPTFGSGRQILGHVDYEREKEAVIQVIRLCDARRLVLEDQKT